MLFVLYILLWDKDRLKHFKAKLYNVDHPVYVREPPYTGFCLLCLPLNNLIIRNNYTTKYKIRKILAKFCHERGIYKYDKNMMKV